MIRKWFKLKAGHITLLQFIIEGYEGMATVSTIDRKSAIIQILIMPDFKDDILPLLEDLQHRFALEEMSPVSTRELLC